MFFFCGFRQRTINLRIFCIVKFSNKYVYITAQSTSLRAETVDGVIPAWPLNITAAKLLFPAGTIRPIHGNIIATYIKMQSLLNVAVQQHFNT